LSLIYKYFHFVVKLEVLSLADSSMKRNVLCFPRIS